MTEAKEGAREAAYIAADVKDMEPVAIVHSLPITDAMRQSVLYEGQPKFKRSLTTEQQQDLNVLQTVNKQRKLGPFTINKVELAPEAMERPDFKAAGEIADMLGLRLVALRARVPEAYSMEEAFISTKVSRTL